GAVDDKHLVSNGLDLIPTLCDYAGIEPPKDLLGTSVRALAEGREPETWRNRLAVESEFGRMMRSNRYKYNVYQSGKHREQLIDLQTDPGDMNNLADDPAHKDVLEQHRKWLCQWVDKTSDEIGKQYVIR
ncbi:MAG: DUF4976 domain-containing protein, partial [Planctomycetes bacterium]|nr:DUF4976 domain-containing protein [Planctomycetota bacterium]